jgi:hypothetical protein
MGFTQKNARKIRLNPTYGNIHQVQSRKMLLPPFVGATAPDVTHPFTSIAQNQTFASLAANAIAAPFSQNGQAIFTNPMLLNGVAGGAGVYTIGQPAGAAANRGVYLSIPAIASLQTVTANATMTWRIRGINHLGIDFMRNGFVETSFGTNNGFHEGGMCWQYIDTIEILSYSGPGTDTLSVGWSNAHGTLSTNRLPIPWDAALVSEIIGVVLVNPGTSGVFATWTIGQLLNPVLTASAQLTPGFVNSVVRFQTGNMTTLGTTPLEYIVIAAVNAINSH